MVTVGLVRVEGECDCEKERIPRADAAENYRPVGNLLCE